MTVIASGPPAAGQGAGRRIPGRGPVCPVSSLDSPSSLPSLLLRFYQAFLIRRRHLGDTRDARVVLGRMKGSLPSVPGQGGTCRHPIGGRPLEGLPGARVMRQARPRRYWLWGVPAPRSRGTGQAGWPTPRARGPRRSIAVSWPARSCIPTAPRPRPRRACRRPGTPPARLTRDRGLRRHRCLLLHRRPWPPGRPRRRPPRRPRSRPRRTRRRHPGHRRHQQRRRRRHPRPPARP